MPTDDGVLTQIQPWSPKLFIVTAVVSIVFGVDNFRRTFEGTSVPVIEEVIVPAGFLLGVVGLLGLYPPFVDRGSRLARAAAGVAVIPAIGWTLLVVGGIGEVAGLLPQGGVLPLAVPMTVIITMVLTYLLFGLATLRTEVYPRSIGLFMLLESANYLVLLSGALPPYVIDAGHAVAYLGLGMTLLANGFPSDSPEPAVDSTAGR